MTAFDIHKAFMDGHITGLEAVHKLAAIGIVGDYAWQFIGATPYASDDIQDIEEQIREELRHGR